MVVVSPIFAAFVRKKASENNQFTYAAYVQTNLDLANYSALINTRKLEISLYEEKNIVVIFFNFKSLVAYYLKKLMSGNSTWTDTSLATYYNCNTGNDVIKSFLYGCLFFISHQPFGHNFLVK